MVQRRTLLTALMLLPVALRADSSLARQPFRLDSWLQQRATSAPETSSFVPQAAPLAGHAPPRGLLASTMSQSKPLSSVNANRPADLVETVGYKERIAQPMQNAFQSMKQTLSSTPKSKPTLDPTNLDFNPGPLQPNLYLSAARMMEQRGQLDEAAKQYQELLKLDPANRAAIIGIARLLHRQGKFNQAIAAYQQVLNKHGQDGVVLNDLALCLARAGRREEAIQAGYNAVSAAPDSLLYRNNLAAILVEAGRPDDAVKVLVESNGPAIAHYNVGYLLNQRGERAKARRHFESALRTDPDFLAARTMLDKLTSNGATRVSVESPVTERETVNPLPQRESEQDESFEHEASAPAAHVARIPTESRWEETPNGFVTRDSDAGRATTSASSRPVMRLPRTQTSKRGADAFVAPLPSATR